jgi:mRNA interferase MazF
VKRGEIWTLAGGPGYAGKPRPVVIIQSDEFDATSSITFCPFTTNDTSAPLFRIPIGPSERNGLHSSSNLMVDKVATVPKARLGKRIGRIDDEDLIRLNRAILVFLGLAAPPSSVTAE